jgi:predicted NBD/HSP70 family sugar kinase
MTPAVDTKLRGSIDLGATKVQAVVVRDRFAVQGEPRHPMPTTGGPQDVAAARAAAPDADLDVAPQ